MTPALIAGIAIFLVGAILWLWASPRFSRAYVARHHVAAPRWPWASSDDPQIERWRRVTLLGIVMLWGGAILAILNPAV